MASGRRSFGQIIRDRRRQLDLGQTEVAKRIGVTPSYVGQLENGRRHPSVNIIGRLAQVLGFEVLDLLLLASPRRNELLVPKADSAVDSVWEQFQNDESLLRIHNISIGEMEILKCVALLGEFRSPRDIIYVLNAVRYAVGR
jgi:transcriptional regulator with XRE-family HTH domain